MDMGVDDRVHVTSRRFYFAKLHEFRNPDLVEGEKLIDLRFTVSQAREEKLVQRNRLQSSLRQPSYYHVENWNRMREGLMLLRLCMNDRKDVITKEAKRSASGMLHGSSSMAKERKAAKKMNEALAKTDTCFEDLGQTMQRLEHTLRQTKHDPCKQKEEILEEIQRLRNTKVQVLGESDAFRRSRKQDAIELLEGSRERVAQHDKEFAISAKELRDVEEELASLDKQLSEIDEVMSGYYGSLVQWRKQYQEENACQEKNVSLISRARKLADEKDLSALERLSKGQVEEFMVRWNDDAEFRNEYKRRARAKTALNSRGQCADGRTRNPDEEPIPLQGSSIKLPNRIRKLLIKQRPAATTRSAS